MNTPGRGRDGSEWDLSSLLLDNVSDYAVFALDLEGRVISWSAPAERLLGYTEEEVLGQPAARFYSPEDVADDVPATELNQARASGRVERNRRCLRKDGSRFWSVAVTTPLLGADGLARGFARILHDGTDSKLAQDARDEALAYVRSIVDTMREPLLVLDSGLRVRSANRAFYQTFRVSPHETEGRRLYDLGDGQWEIPRLRNLLEEILPGDLAFDDFEVAHTFPGVGHRVMLLNARRLRQQSSQDELILLAIDDVTEQRQAEAERQAIAARFTSLVKNVRDHSIFTLDPEGRITSWNVAAEQILGYSEDEALGRHFAFIFTPADREAGLPEAELKAARALGRAEDERWHLRKGGERFWALGIVSALHDADGRLAGFSKILRDMTAWKDAERALCDSHRRLQGILASIPLAVVVIDAASGRFSYMNERAIELYGCDYLGVDLESHLEQIAALRPDGTPFPTEALPATRVMRARETVHGEEMLIHRADGKLFPVAVSCAPLFDGQGHLDAVIGVFEDISDRRRAEASLQEANRRKDVFLATLAHELRNPLMPIRTGLDLLQALLGDADACEEPLRIMDRQFTHLVHLVDDLMDLSRISRGKVELRKELLDLAQIVDAALEMAKDTAVAGRRHLSVSVPAEPLTVEGDRVRLVQILANLLNNAAKFTDEGGRIALRVARRGQEVQIEVEDDGHGIAPARLGEVFEMFSQAEAGQGVGLGIGLNLVRSLVALHGGSVTAASEGQGRGATFTVSLPLCQDEPPRPVRPETADAGQDSVSQCRVLVVDDNRDIAEGLCLLLTTLQADVRVANDGHEALRVCADWTPTHVLMDLGMPGMDGYETARRLCAAHPDRAFRLVAVSGWGQDEDRKRAREAGFDQHLVKPVGVAALKSLLAG
jgi:PAS domain S-box-containing protein